MEVTQDFMKDLWRAREIVFFHREGTGTIRLLDKDSRPAPNDLQYWEAEYGLASQIRNYERYGWDANLEAPERTYAFEMDGQETLNTLRNVLKKGDEIKLRWIAGNDNGYTRAAFLHLDELRLQIQRGARNFEVMLAVSVCPDNSARMVRANADNSHPGRYWGDYPKDLEAAFEQKPPKVGTYDRWVAARHKKEEVSS